jgi:hypothetical protein
MSNFIASDRVHYVQDQELNPSTYAEQFVDPDPLKAQPPEELLRRARLILSTELGKDPLLRDYVRRLFKDEALVTVRPLEKGLKKIDSLHPYNVCLLGSPEFLFIYLFLGRVSNISFGSLSAKCWRRVSFCRSKMRKRDA